MQLLLRETGPVPGAGARGGHEAEHHGERQEDQRHQSAGAGGVPHGGGVHAASSRGQPLTEKTSPSAAHEAHRLRERRQALECTGAPDQRRRGDQVGLHAASPGRRDEHPVGLGAVAGLGIDHMVAGPAPGDPGTGRGGGTGQAAPLDGDHLVDVRRRRGGLAGDAHRPAAGRRGPRHGDVAAEADQDATAEAVGDASGGPVGRERLGTRAQVEAHAAGDADGAVDLVQLHVGIPGHPAERAAGRAGGPAPRRGPGRSPAPRWRCPPSGRRRRSCAPRRHTRPEVPRRAAGSPGRPHRHARARTGARSQGGTGCRKYRWRRARAGEGRPRWPRHQRR